MVKSPTNLPSNTTTTTTSTTSTTTVQVPVPSVFNQLGDGFNNKDAFPDLTFHLVHSNTNIVAHKFIVSQNSETLRACLQCNMSESQRNEIVIDEEQSQYDMLFTRLIQSFYTGRIEMESAEQDLVPLLILMDKYQVNESMEQVLSNYLADHLSNDNVLSCFMLDLNKRVHSQLYENAKRFLFHHSRELLSCNVNSHDNYLMNLDYSIWYNLLSVLVTSSTSDLAYDALERWIEHDRDNRLNYSFQLLKLINSKKKENHILSPSCWKFDRSSIPSNVTLSNNDRTVTSNAFNYDKWVWVNVPLREQLISTSTTINWSVIISRHNCWIGVGVGLKLLPVKSGWTSCRNHGLFLYSSNGYCWSHSTDSENAKPVGVKAIAGDIISVTYNPSNSTLMFMKNDSFICTLSNVTGGELFPVVVPANEHETVTLNS